MAMSSSHRHDLLTLVPLSQNRSRLAAIERSSALLQRASVAPSTASAYLLAVSHFSAYCRSLPRHPHHSLPHRAASLDLDTCVSGYISLIYAGRQGANRQRAVNVVYGLYLCMPEMRGMLRRSEQLLLGWSRLQPPVSHPPLTWPLMLLVAATMAKNGFFDCAIATLVAFDSLLRVSELVGIRVRDVSSVSDPRRGRHSSSSAIDASPPSGSSSTRVCVRLSTTKTGSNQWAELYTSEVGQLLVRWLSDRSPEHHVFRFPVSTSRRSDHFRQVMRVVCDSLGLTAYHFTPHSLRHGGATHAYLHLSQSIEHVMHRGRWRSNDACRTYIQAGRAALLTQELPARLTALAADLALNWYPIMESLCFAG